MGQGYLAGYLSQGGELQFFSLHKLQAKTDSVPVKLPRQSSLPTGGIADIAAGNETRAVIEVAVKHSSAPGQARGALV